MKLIPRSFRKKRRPIAAPEPQPLSARFPDAIDWQLEIMDAVMPHTMTSPERIFALIEAVTYLCQNNIPGDLIECGVWKGGSSAAIARTLVHFGQSDRTLWLYDTFEGMSAPTESDVDFGGHAADDLLENQDIAESASIWCRSPLEEVQQTMTATGYPTEKIHFVKGKVEDTLPQQSPDRSPNQVALLRLDTDWYESTKCELEHLYPAMSSGAVLIIDDYGHWQGCRKAVDEYITKNKISILLNRIDYTGRIGIVCPAGNTNG